ncbi:MAG: hypothetical protein JWO98_2357, partial [Frankiales bacterium]|nr:hypothetical protein [Frankiales bacterium]
MFLSRLLDAPVLDGIASMIIGLVLACAALFLAYETRGLLVGEVADAELVRRVVALAA